MDVVLVDHRERSSAIPDALVAAGLDVRLTDLPVGDYVVGPGLAIERKGPHDLGASIRDGRIFEQAVRLQSAFAQAVLLIEGEPRGIAEDAWRGAVCRLVEDGFTVLHSLDAEDSAAWIVRLAKRARRAAPTVPTIGPRRGGGRGSCSGRAAPSSGHRTGAGGAARRGAARRVRRPGRARTATRASRSWPANAATVAAGRARLPGRVRVLRPPGRRPARPALGARRLPAGRRPHR